MRIAQIAPCWLTVPPDGYGGLESVVATLTDGLVDRGHDVTLFAPGGSDTRAGLTSWYDTPVGIEQRSAQPLLELPHVLHAYARAADFEVVHDHTFLLGPAVGAGLARPPVVHTLHTAPYLPPASDVYGLLADRLHFVAVSNYQRLAMPQLAWAATIPNGIVLDDFRYEPVKEDYLLFVGRMTPAKGAHLAAAAALRCGRRLVIAGKMKSPAERSYFDDQVAPMLGDLVTYAGEVRAGERRDLYAGAACTLVPLQWAEPFGLVMVESLASGTPVVALRRGAAPEIVDHGVTGFLARSFEELVGYIPEVDNLDPAACRKAAAARFCSSRMVEEHERLYRRITG